MAAHDRSHAGRVRDLCRQLKPIIGEQADRIWMAYVAEGEDGKSQIAEYLELTAAQQFQVGVDSEGPGLIPPSADEAAGEYDFGNVTYNGQSMCPFGLRESEWTQHVGVFGRSGAGKTNLGFVIVQHLIEQKKPALILDWKRNYRDLLKKPGFEDVHVHTIGRRVSPWSFNPLIPPPQTNPKTWLKKLISVVAHAYLLGDGVMFLLQEAIDGVYEEAGVYSGSIDRWPTFRDVLTALKERRSTGREAGWMSSALRAISTLCFGEMDVLVNQGHADIVEMLDRTVILELDALTQSDKVFFSSTLLAWIHEYRMAQPIREKFRHAIVLEEAHHLIASGQRKALVGGESTMDVVFREVRELGESLIYLDQHPSQVSIQALGNTYAVFCFNLKHKSDVTAISQSMMLEDDERSALNNLRVGQAVVRLQGRSMKPFMISVPEFAIHKGTFSDTDVVRHMTRLGALQEPKTMLQAERHTSPSEASLSSVQPEKAGAEMVLLADVVDFPTSGVAERYRRLGLSVRQGQKLKDASVAIGLIVEELQITQNGKMRVIRLTEKGRRLLSEGSHDRSKAA